MDPNLAIIDKLQNQIMSQTDVIRGLRFQIVEAQEEIVQLRAKVEELTADNELLENIAWSEKL